MKNYAITFFKKAPEALSSYESTLYVKSSNRFGALLKAYRRAIMDTYGGVRIVGIKYIVNLSGPSHL